MSAQSKNTRNQKILLDLASQPGNNICADCKARLPRWTSYNLGIFICVNCASIHRKIGTHITKVKSLTMDEWTKEQVETMRSIGNVRSNAIYNPNEIRNPPPPNLEDSERDSEIELYIRAKYEYKKFFDKSALVASKLGPSRKASSAPAPSHSAPLPPPIPRSSSEVTKPNVPISSASTSSNTVPPRPPQVLPIAQPAQPSGGVWDDINLLKNDGQNSSLPLQYQQPTYSQGNPSMQLPTVNINTNNYPVGATASGLNPYQPNQVRLNPFSQSQSPFAPPMTSPFSASSGQFGPTFQTPHNPQPQIQNSPIFQTPIPTYVHSQPQNPLGQGLLSASPNQPFPSASPSQLFPSASPSQPFPSAPAGQSQFLHSPQQLQPSSSPQFMYPSPASAQPQLGSHNVSGYNQFLGMTTMQMQQQQALQQQQQQMQQQLQQQHQQQLGQNYYSSMQPPIMSGQVNGMYGQTSTYPQGGFPSQTGGQWGTM